MSFGLIFFWGCAAGTDVVLNVSGQLTTRGKTADNQRLKKHHQAVLMMEWLKIQLLMQPLISFWWPASVAPIHTKLDQNAELIEGTLLFFLYTNYVCVMERDKEKWRAGKKKNGLTFVLFWQRLCVSVSYIRAVHMITVFYSMLSLFTIVFRLFAVNKT